MRWLLLSILIAFLATGCTDERKSDDALITEVARTYVEAMYNGDPADAYELLDSRSQALCGKRRIIELGAMYHAMRETFLTITFDRVEDIEIDGDKATAKVFRKVNGSTRYYESRADHFVKEKGKWRYAEPAQYERC
ncbi:MAG: nuclear transport factor 2 family protein [Dehalococcoidia bacterium]